MAARPLHDILRDIVRALPFSDEKRHRALLADVDAHEAAQHEAATAVYTAVNGPTPGTATAAPPATFAAPAPEGGTEDAPGTRF